ncbi:MAG: methionyl-tRNA formyltransferase [Rhodothalassiaceae bacterium]
MRLAFMGSPAFAVPSLQALIDADHDIAAVYTQPPRPAGRGKRPQKTLVHRLAEAYQRPVRTPETLKSADTQAAFAALNVDVAVVVAYGLILPKPILAAPRLGCVNVHASLLPRWRGAAPIHRAVLAGDSETGVAIMAMEPGLDTGPVLATAKTPIAADDTTASLHARLAQMGAQLLVPTLEAYGEGRLTPMPQPEEGVTYAAKINKAEARIDWHEGAEAVDRRVRALSPAPGAWTELAGERIKILAGTPLSDDVTSKGRPGTLIAEPLVIACGLGAYQVSLAQRAGKAPMAADELMRGLNFPAGVAAS